MSILAYATAGSHMRDMTAASAKLATLRIHILESALRPLSAKIKVVMRIAMAMEPAIKMVGLPSAHATQVSQMMDSINVLDVLMLFSPILIARRDNGSFLSLMSIAKILSTTCQDKCSTTGL
jgi:hypothetical protein